jgi:nucleotide-binding universal stress UspA family protein
MSAKFSTIVVGVDGSAGAEEALEMAADLASAFGSKVHVAIATRHVSAAEWNETLQQLPHEFWDSVDLHADATAVLAAAASKLEERGIDVEKHLCIDHVADALIGVAEREHADLIVVGSRGLGAAKRTFLGSVSSKMAHHAPCAVLIAGSRQS